jgi:hypothetical protein
MTEDPAFDLRRGSVCSHGSTGYPYDDVPVQMDTRTDEMKTKTTIITENDLPPEVIRAIEQGRKIEAIKLLREATGLGLANAKVLVDKAGRQHTRGSAQPRLVEDQPNLGRLLKALFLVALAFAFYRYYTGG